jgi:hypothetical protein
VPIMRKCRCVGTVLGYRDKALGWLTARPIRFALVVGVCAFSIYAITATGGLQGYDPETAATAEGLVRTGDFKVLPDSVYVAKGSIGQGVGGKDGKLVGRAGLPQPLLMAPFYAVGRALDQLNSGGSTTRFRHLAIVFYNPAVAALAAALVFLIVLRIRCLSWAIAVAAMFTVASIAWPYSKIGMDNTVMMGVVLTATGALWATGSGSAWPWALAGFGAGLTVAAKAYEAPALAVILALLWRPFLSAPRERRRRLLLAVATPIALWVVAIGWYNWLREGSIFKTGSAAYNDFTLAAPFNALGFFFSPGKGLVFYSPLVALGLFGLVNLWRANRRLAAVIIGAVAAGTAVVAVNAFWTDETWGPRYIVPVAWLLLLPIPWWATTRARRRVLCGVAVGAVCVQLVAVAAPYAATVRALPWIVGAPIYQARVSGYASTPYGSDVIRWIPQLSPLVIQSALVVSWAGMKLGAPPLTYRYAPFLGPPHELTMDRTLIRYVGIPDLWWRAQGGLGLLCLAVAVVAVIAAAALLAPPVLAAGRINVAAH